MAVHDTRPFYLNLLKIRLPVPGVVSIFHRVSGVLMFLAIPATAYLLDLSLQGEQGFSRASEILAQPFSQLVLIVLIWSLLHHLFAGIRFLLIDFDIGLDKEQSCKTAWLVFAAEIIAMIIIAAGIYL
ncbi:MAG: succinate dehydrogenase, cytochrome b556 subunit [Gammaproteobacteria bacterium]|nr:succinate dehydrogenase, cytochrome b556 subunit [Gammaproteobacteria bacterium]